MKSKILKKILGWLTIKILKKYNPTVIAITGSVGKTTTKDAIFTLLEGERKVRKSEENFNTDIGVPLAFIGVKGPGNSFKEWLSIIFKGLKLIIFKDKDYPNYLVVEMAADRKGDIDYLTNIAPPDIGVVTAIGDIPVHIEFFENVNEIIKEKSLLVKKLKRGGRAILNADDGRVFQMKGRTRGKVTTFGKSKQADFKIKEINFLGKEKPEGARLSISYKTQEHQIDLPHVFDRGTIISISAALSLAASLKIPLYRLSEKASKIVPPKGRMRLLEGVNNSYILDSSYNSAPSSNRKALEALKELPGKRKVAFLGDMLELGDYALRAHKEAIKEAHFVDVLITIGDNFKEVSNLFKGESYHFSNSKEALKKARGIIKEGDLVLVKGSQGIRTEKIVEALLKDSSKAKKVLVRQNYPWIKDEEETQK